MSIALRRAEDPVQRVLRRIAEWDTPFFGVDPGVMDDRELGALREVAERRAQQVGRVGLIDEAFDRIAAGFASRLGDAGQRLAIYGVMPPTSAEHLAAAQVALQDLVLAAAVEDLLTPDEVASLSAAGEILLLEGEELPLDWTPPPVAETATAASTTTAQDWSRGEVVGGVLLVALAVLAGWLAAHDVLAGVGLGLGAAAVLFLWRREKPAPPDTDP